MKEEEYMRVGTTLYKVVNQPCANGTYSGAYPFTFR